MEKVEYLNHMSDIIFLFSYVRFIYLYFADLRKNSI